MGIRNQVFFIFSVIIMLIIGLGIYAIHTGENALEASIDQETTAQARTTMQAVDKAIYDRIEIFREYTQDLIFQEALAQANQEAAVCEEEKKKIAVLGNSFSGSEKRRLLAEEMEEKLKYYQKRNGYPLFFEVLVTDKRGSILARAGINKHFENDGCVFSTASGREIVTTTPLIDTFTNGDVHLDIGFPILDEERGEKQGEFFMSINLQDILTQLNTALHQKGHHAQHRSMHFSLLDRENHIIFSTLPLSKGEDVSWMVLPETPSGSTIVDNRQYVYVSSMGYLDFDGLGWKVVIRHDLSEVFSPIDRLRYTLLLVIAIVVIIALFTALITSRIIVNPISQLTRSAQAIAEGKLDSTVSLQAYGELGKLITTFNNMGSELAKSRHRVEEEIKKSKKAATALLENEKRMKAITDSAQDAIIMIDNNEIIIFANPAATQILGHSQDELIGKNVHTLLAPEHYRQAYEKGIATFKTTGKGGAIGKTLELSARHKDGHEFPIDISLSSVYYNNSWHAIGLIRDISERKANEASFKRQEEIMIAQSRQAAMGDMIAMIAHQWRQPITVIAMAVNNIKIAAELGQEIKEEKLYKMIDTVSHQVQHLSQTIDDFRNFFKPNKTKQIAAVCTIIDNTLGIIGKSLENNGIRLVIEEKCHGTILTYPNELVQVFLNLVGNAKDAIQKQDPKEPLITITVNEKGGIIETTICDNGGGIPEAYLNKIGEPYFSTKAEGGTGLGIYMSKTIIEKHLGGRLTWHNKTDEQYGTGACFTITLPFQKNEENPEG